MPSLAITAHTCAPLPIHFMRNPPFPEPDARPEGVREQDHTRGRGEASWAEPSPLERLLHSLLLPGDEPEVEARVVTGLGELTGATWVAYFYPEGAELVCRAVDGPGPRVGETLPDDHPPARDLDHAAPVGFPEGSYFQDRLSPQLLIPLSLLDGERGLLVLGPHVGGAPYGRAVLAVLARAADASAIALRNAQLVERLRSQVFVDYLTGCYNRRGFEEHLRVEMERARRYRRPLTLLLLDLDQFKLVNDQHGHQAGDYVLRHLGALLLETFRTTDFVCRYGGDEFAIIFPETPKAEVLRLAERLRRHLGALFPDGVISTPVTASVGVAAIPSDAADAMELIRRADRALYHAKAGGRDRVVAADAAPDPSLRREP